MRSTPWVFDDTGHLTVGDVVKASAGKLGSIDWSTVAGEGATTQVSASVMRMDGMHPPQALYFQWSLNDRTGHVTLVGFREDGEAKPLLYLAMAATLWRLQ